MGRVLCWLLGHKYKGPHPYETRLTVHYYLFKDYCVRCGFENRFWNTNKELGLTTPAEEE